LWRDRQPHAGIADKVPARKTAVAPVVGIAEHAFQCQAPYVIKKVGGAAFHCFEHRVLLAGREFGETRAREPFTLAHRSRPILRVSRVFGGQRACQGSFEVIRHTALDSARAVIVLGDQPVEERFQNEAFGRGEY